MVFFAELDGPACETTFQPLDLGNNLSLVFNHGNVGGDAYNDDIGIQCLLLILENLSDLSRSCRSSDVPRNA